MCNLAETVYTTSFQLMTKNHRNNLKSTTFLEHTELRPRLRWKSFKVSPSYYCLLHLSCFAFPPLKTVALFLQTQWMMVQKSKHWKGSTQGHALNTYSQQCELNQSLNKLAQIQKWLWMRCYRKKSYIERQKSVKEILIPTREKPNQTRIPAATLILLVLLSAFGL